MSNTGTQSTEKEMWNILKDRTGNERQKKVRISFYATNSIAGLHKQRCNEIVKSWRNKGLVNAYVNGAHASLTEKGVETDDPTDL